MPENFRVILQNRPGVQGEPKETNFHHEVCPFPNSPEPGQVLVKTLYLSVDPALRCRMNESTGVEYMGPWALGEMILGLGGVGEVYQSNHEGYTPGDLVQGAFSWPWTNYFIWEKTSGMDLDKVDRSLVGDRPSLILSVLGLTGLTSLLGIREKGQLTPGANETVVISGAAGACGSLAGQIAKLEGAGKVIGICGSDEKCDYLTGDLVFDSAINYKTQNVAEKLKTTCPDGIQVYFDNVGGDISETVISQMTPNSRVILCGQISVYNNDVPYPPPISASLEAIIAERKISRDRFLVLNYAAKFKSGLEQLITWLADGKIKVRETVAEGLEKAGSAFVSMMKGGNIGKQIVHVADPTKNTQ
ncbi:prostaglandin reductase 2-like [Liolophura sinensis]|uniref:prostaglandin reductase 2-like n=1 Tax=Liolophura sinensis TaxID=3198878 RepID=UPI003159893C